MIRLFLGSSAGLLFALMAPLRSHAQSADSPSSSPVATATVAAAATFDAAHDSSAIAAAETLGLTEPQRKLFYQNIEAVAQYLLAIKPAGGRPAVDSALSIVIRETSRKMKFLRQARLLFSEMYARRQGDNDRAAGTEEELWRSPRNVNGLITLYRKNPNATDFEIERALAPSFRAH
jgi:hypothetical protein